MNIQGITPAINAPLQAQDSSTTGTSGSSNDSGSNGLSSSQLQSTFLNLLVTELQNQDPTQPVDPTEMVGQMVSLNELDQLISINQTLSSMSGSAGTGTSGTGTQSSIASNPVSAANASAAKTSNAPLAQFQLQPAAMSAPVPGGLMNLYGNIAAQTANSNSNHATQGGR